MRSTLPKGIDRRELILELARRLAEHPAGERVWLFGSRARGDHFERSDIDLAIEAPTMDRYDWLKLLLDFEEDAPTLLCIDLVRMEETPEHLREQIHDQGLVVHERSRVAATVWGPRPLARPAGRSFGGSCR